MRQDDDNLELPEGLKGELRGLYGPGQSFPSGRDQRILQMAMRGRRGWKVRSWMMSGAIAAAVAVMAGGLWYWQWENSAASSAPAYVKTGDVRDAFYLARELKAGKKPAGSWDANGDGVVDDRDVRVVALAAVRVSGEGGVR